MNLHHPLTLFILKKFHDYDGHGATSACGLRNSATFVVELLGHEGHRAKLAYAVDANCIDRIVTEARPAAVVLEAIWVTPAKMAELLALHPLVRWCVRIHSEIPFLANEGIAVDWIAKYLALGVEVAFNSAQTAEDFRPLGRVTYLPNAYPLRHPRTLKPKSDTLDIGCFGAIRPLKNQLMQAFGAVMYAAAVGLPMTFHMNGSRVEQQGGNCLKNIEALFAATPDCTLELHQWLGHEDLLELVAGMDVCLQVSLSESFNLTSADAVSIGVPLIGSDAIAWLPKRSRAKVDSAASICAALHRADRTTVAMNHEALERYLASAAEVWNDWARQNVKT